MNDETYNRRRAKAPKRTGGYVPPTFVGFIDPYLSPSELEAQKSMVLSAEEAFDSLLKFIEEGFCVKFSWDANNRCHQATATPKQNDHDYAGMYLVGRGSEPLKALKQLLFKHYTILNGVWSVDYIKTGREDYE